MSIHFVAWLCGCTDMVHGRVTEDYAACHHHDAPISDGPVEVTPGVSTNLGHMCPTTKEQQ